MNDLWSAALKRISRKIGPKSYRDWFEPTELQAIQPDEVRVHVPNVLVKEWLDKNFRGVVEEVLAELAEESPQPSSVPRGVTFVVADASPPASEPPRLQAAPEPAPLRRQPVRRASATPPAEIRQPETTH